jgi:hypothetical protein
LQAELHGRIEKALDGGKGNHQPLGDAAERQPDLEAIFRHHQVPELVLQDDGHLLRILREQARRKPYAVRLRQEGDEEMMLARQSVLGSVAQHATEHSAQRVARQHVISDVIGRHVSPCKSSIGLRQPADSPFSDMLPRPHAQVSRRGGRNLGQLRAFGEENAVNESGGFCCQVPPNPA